jgi:hypothetical protein
MAGGNPMLGAGARIAPHAFGPRTDGQGTKTGQFDRLSGLERIADQLEHALANGRLARPVASLAEAVMIARVMVVDTADLLLIISYSEVKSL